MTTLKLCLNKNLVPARPGSSKPYPYLPCFYLYLPTHQLPSTHPTGLALGSTGSTWQGGSAPPTTLSGNDVVNVNHRVELLTGSIEITGTTVINVNNILKITNGSLTIDNNVATVNIISGVVIMPNGGFLNKNGVVNFNLGGVQMCNSGYKDESSGGSQGTTGTGYIFAATGNIENIGNAPFSSNVPWCSLTDPGTNMPTTEDCPTATPPNGCTDETFYLTFLPVELTSFAAEIIDGDVLLSWTTETEINNEKFLIERRLQGSQFESIGEVGGAGTTYETQHYQFMDERPLGDVNYYRLKQLDFDGKFEYSATVSINMARVDVYHIWPSTTSGQVHLEWSKEEEVDVQVYDLNGALLLSKTIQGDKESTMDISNFSSGMYLVCVKTDYEVFTYKIMKK